MLGRERLETVTIHHGPNTFLSHALAGGRTLAEVRDAAGHANVTITSVYLHATVEDDAVGNLFRRLRRAAGGRMGHYGWSNEKADAGDLEIQRVPTLPNDIGRQVACCVAFSLSAIVGAVYPTSGVIEVSRHVPEVRFGG